MKIKRKLLSCLLISIFFLGAGSTHAIDRAEYAESVMNILRAHVSLLRELTLANRFKYSDNVVRHATAIQRTFGLLGPMEWHAAESARLHSTHRGDGEKLNEDMFEELGRASRHSIRELVRAAHDSMEEYDRQRVLKAISDMKQACDNCHSLLPKSVAPDLWGPLERD